MEQELIQEMKDRKIKILGLSEIKKKGNGIKKLQDGYILRYSGVGMDRRTKEGVWIIITSEQLETKVSGWELINSRILVIDLHLEINLLKGIYHPYVRQSTNKGAQIRGRNPTNLVTHVL